MNRIARDFLTLMICRALVFGLLLGCVPTPKPPFDLARLTPEKVLDVVEWLGSLDLSQPGPVIQGLHLTPDPRGIAAHERDGGITRAFLRWRLRPQGDFFSYETCVRVQDLRKRFGAPVEEFLIPHGGRDFLFRVSSLGGWRTYTKSR